jgi:hypothetical protein
MFVTSKAFLPESKNVFSLKLFHKHANTKLILLKTGPKENMQEVLFFVNKLSCFFNLFRSFPSIFIKGWPEWLSTA